MSDIFNDKVNFEPPVINRGGRAIVPSDSYDDTLAEGKAYRTIYVGTGGNLRLRTIDGSELTFVNLPNGAALNLAVTKVFSTDTTASDIIGLF